MMPPPTTPARVEIPTKLATTIKKFYLLTALFSVKRSIRLLIVYPPIKKHGPIR